MEEALAVQNFLEITIKPEDISIVGMVQMLKQQVKRAIAKGIRRFRSYVQSLETEVGVGSDQELDGVYDPSRYQFAYVWLNSILMKLVTEEGKGLRPNYTWGVLQGVHLAKVLGIDRVSVIEFGVAGGNGLVSLERSAERIEDLLGVGVDVYGFDTGCGLPKPLDYRDCPNLWSQGLYRIDEEKLRKRLQRARLLLGLVDETVPQFIKSKPSPIAFISFDLDYYSSTAQALKLLEEDPALLLPRIYCYFDDILGFTYSEYNGERLAISEFNASHDMRKISPIYGMRYYLPSRYSTARWSEQFYIAHIFDHDLYCRNDSFGGASWGTDLGRPPGSAGRDKLLVEDPKPTENSKAENRSVGTSPSIQAPADSSTVLLGEDDLSDFIDDTVIIARALDGRICLWNRYAEELYGWRKEEAIGRISHDLLKTQFPQPLPEIDSDLVRDGRWEGELVQTARDGGRLVLKAQWTLVLKKQSREVVEIGRPATDL
jgi:PAS domain S-box-containing protein